MQLGYYWAHHTKRNEWCIVQVVQGLNGAVFENGYSVPVGEFDEIDPTPVVRIEIGDKREALAAYAHEAWSGWMQYMFSKGTIHDDFTWTMPVSLLGRWQRQMRTAYADLPESEKESDRTEADKMLQIFRQAPFSDTRPREVAE